MMRTRPATTRDLHRLAQITITSLVDDPTFDYMWPHRHEYPEDNFFYWQLTLKQWLYNPMRTFIVVVLDATDDNGAASLQETTTSVPLETIISFAVWNRNGRSAVARRRRAEKDTWLNFLDRTTAAIEKWSVSRKYGRRDTDMERLHAISLASEIDRAECFSDVEDWWELELLVTDRPFRGRGAATALVKWGTTTADAEEVCCGVEASGMGAKVYEACGFAKLKTSEVQVPGQEQSLQYDVMRRNAVAKVF